MISHSHGILRANYTTVKFTSQTRGQDYPEQQVSTDLCDTRQTELPALADQILTTCQLSVLLEAVCRQTNCTSVAGSLMQ